MAVRERKRADAGHRPAHVPPRADPDGRARRAGPAGTQPAEIPDAGARAAVDADELRDEIGLVQRACDGDAWAFERLLRRYQQPMFVLAAGITGSPADGEDAAQAAFVIAWRKLPSFRGDARFATWLYRIVTNESLSLLRRRRPVDPLPERADLQPADPPSRGPEATTERAALGAALATALARLPPDLRAAWVLREAEHCSYEEVASIVGVNLSTARGRIARARALLARSMADWL